MTQAQPGQLAPDFTLATLDGPAVTLSHGRGRSYLLVFLRHLG
jgi:peroxiredoxin